MFLGNHTIQLAYTPMFGNVECHLRSCSCAHALQCGITLLRLEGDQKLVTEAQQGIACAAR